MRLKEYWISDHGMWSEILEEFFIRSVFDQEQWQGDCDFLSLFIVYEN